MTRKEPVTPLERYEIEKVRSAFGELVNALSVTRIVTFAVVGVATVPVISPVGLTVKPGILPPTIK